MPIATPLRRLPLLLLVLLALVSALIAGLPRADAQSSDNQRYASIVVDAATGETLFARNADSSRYPASITKMMTLYLTFEALSQGKANLDDTVTVSPLAASQPPSKLGLRAGETIRLDDAMRATTVRSANDMAMAIAEHIGGSQAQFAAMATLKARQLGMTGTRYVNPNGLPDSRQITTARDLSILARAIMRDYPQYYSYFGLHDWAYAGRAFRNTNGLLLQGNGYDGIKTGFTNASGFNLAASAVRDNRRLIVIVLGGRTTASRNAHVASLMDTGFELERMRAQGQPIQIAQTFFEQRGFGLNGPDASGSGPVAYASAGRSGEDDEGGATPYAAVAARAPTPAPTVTYASAAGVSTARPYVGAPPPSTPPSAAPPARQNPGQISPSLRAEAGRPPANLTASLNGSTGAMAATPAPSAARRPATAAPARTPPRPPAGRWSVQVGAFRDEAVARNWVNEVNRRFRSQFANAERDVQTAGAWYRSRFTGLTEDAAKTACAALSERRVTCMVIRPE